jgi:cation transport ATPase
LIYLKYSNILLQRKPGEKEIDVKNKLYEIRRKINAGEILIGLGFASTVVAMLAWATNSIWFIALFAWLQIPTAPLLILIALTPKTYAKSHKEWKWKMMYSRLIMTTAALLSVAASTFIFIPKDYVLLFWVPIAHGVLYILDGIGFVVIEEITDKSQSGARLSS